MLRAGLWHRGMTRLVGIESPDIGKNWKIQVPSTPEGVWWRLKAVAWNLLTSATVATRSPRLFIGASDFTDASRTVVEQLQGAHVVINHNQTQAANLEGFFFFYEGCAKTAANAAQTELPHDLRIQPGYFVGSICGAMDQTAITGDQFRCIRLLVEEWIYEPPGERTPNAGDGSDRVDFVKLNGTLERLAGLLESAQATP